MFSSGFSEGLTNVNEKRVVSTEVDFHTLHNILHYLYTNQITFHSKPGKEPTNGPITVDVQSIYEAADRFLLPLLKDKALNFLRCSCDIQNVTGRMFGEFARKHEDLDLHYRFFFQTHLPLIVQTIEFDDFFERLEGSDAGQTSAFRKLVQDSLRGKKLVASQQSTTSTCNETDDEDDDNDSADLDYEPDDDQKEDEEMEDEEEEDENEGQDMESSEESSEEEEE